MSFEINFFNDEFSDSAALDVFLPYFFKGHLEFAQVFESINKSAEKNQG